MIGALRADVCGEWQRRRRRKRRSRARRLKLGRMNEASGDLGGPPRLARWLEARKAERERTAALVAAGVIDEAAYEEPREPVAKLNSRNVGGDPCHVLHNGCSVVEVVEPL